MVNPLKSRRFLTLLLDTVVSVALHYLGGEDVKFLIGALQPIFVFLILAYTTEDSLRLMSK